MRPLDQWLMKSWKRWLIFILGQVTRLTQALYIHNMADFTLPQQQIVFDRSEKLKTYLTDEEIEKLKKLAGERKDLPAPTIHGLIEDVLKLTGSENLTWSGRVELLKNIQRFIYQYEESAR